jgi:ribosome biogenesis GTPase A
MNVDQEEPLPDHGDVRNAEMQKLIETATPEALEAKVADYKHLLGLLMDTFKSCPVNSQDNKHWLEQLSNLQNITVNTPTVIGVVGNTGAGKSSVINALLEEERLVPTNCSMYSHSSSHAILADISFSMYIDSNRL